MIFILLMTSPKFHSFWQIFQQIVIEAFRFGSEFAITNPFRFFLIKFFPKKLKKITSWDFQIRAFDFLYTWSIKALVIEESRALGFHLLCTYRYSKGCEYHIGDQKIHEIKEKWNWAIILEHSSEKTKNMELVEGKPIFLTFALMNDVSICSLYFHNST